MLYHFKSTIYVVYYLARLANKFFFFRHLNKRPFITIKIASSSDGMSHAEDGSIKWITSAAAREDILMAFFSNI